MHLPLIRVPHWVFAAVLPFAFCVGCSCSVRPIMYLAEHAWVRPVQERDLSWFPVMAKGGEGGYCTTLLGEPRADAKIVVDDFDEEAINRSLNAWIRSWPGGRRLSSRDYRYFEVIDRAPGLTRVCLEVPTLKDSKTKAWYEIRAGEIHPVKILRYGPGIVVYVGPYILLGGFIALGICWMLIRPWPRTGKSRAQRSADADVAAFLRKQGDGHDSGGAGNAEPEGRRR